MSTLDKHIMAVRRGEITKTNVIGMGARRRERACRREGKLTMTIRSGDVERAMNAIGYSHGRHKDQQGRINGFRKIVKGSNFCTPRVAGLYRLKAKPYVIVEVSLGDGIFNQEDTMIGFTVVDTAKAENCHDLSDCVHSLDEMQDKFRSLEKHFS